MKLVWLYNIYEVLTLAVTTMLVVLMFVSICKVIAWLITGVWQ